MMMKTKRVRKPKIVKLKLPLKTDTVVEVVPAKGVIPVVIVHPETKSVYVAPSPAVKTAAKEVGKPMTWMEYLFGSTK